MKRRAHRSQTFSRPRPPGRYNGPHKAMGRRLDPIVKTGTVRCVRCNEFIAPDESWHLDHHERGGWLGPAHARCNLGAGWEKMAGRGGDYSNGNGAALEWPYRWSQRWSEDPPVGTTVNAGPGLVEVYLGSGQWSRPWPFDRELE